MSCIQRVLDIFEIETLLALFVKIFAFLIGRKEIMNRNVILTVNINFFKPLCLLLVVCDELFERVLIVIVPT